MTQGPCQFSMTMVPLVLSVYMDVSISNLNNPLCLFHLYILKLYNLSLFIIPRLPVSFSIRNTPNFKIY